MKRFDGRNADELRKVIITRNYIKHAEGSVLIEMGDTKVICTATVEDKVPLHKKGTGQGWITAEYNMLPRATNTRNQRDISRLKLSGRTAEIQRLIGRSLRMAVDMTIIGERTITIDCDVIQADGGTRTAAITGGFVAMNDALLKLKNNGSIEKNPIKYFVAAVSVGMIDGFPMLDLCYEEDSKAEVDMNVVINEHGEFIELQGTGENAPFGDEQLAKLLKIAKSGIAELINIQKDLISK